MSAPESLESAYDLPTRPKTFPKMKKFLLPKMSLKRPAIGVTTAAAKDQEVAIHAICVDGPMAALMFKRMAAGRTKEKRQAS